MMTHDPGISPAEQIRLAGLGVYLDTPLPTVPPRLSREVAARWDGQDDSHNQFQDDGWKRRDVLAAYAMRPLVDEVAQWREDSRWWRRAAFIASAVAIGALIALIAK